MPAWLKVTLVALVFGVPTIPLGRMLWPSPAGSAEPSAMQLPFFIFLGIFEAVSFGLGMAFIIFGWPLMKRLLPESPRLTWAAFVSIAWFLVSWWPHDGLHSSNRPDDLSRLLGIEYGFHVTLIIGGVILAYWFIRLAQRVVAQTNPVPSSR